MGRRAIRSATPFNSLWHYDAQGKNGYQCKAPVIFYGDLVQVIEPAVAFWINIFWLYQSPCKRPGCFLIQGIIGKSIRIIFGNDSRRSAGIERSSHYQEEYDNGVSDVFGRNHVTQFYWLIKFHFTFTSIFMIEKFCFSVLAISTSCSCDLKVNSQNIRNQQPQNLWISTNLIYNQLEISMWIYKVKSVKQKYIILKPVNFYWLYKTCDR